MLLRVMKNLKAELVSGPKQIYPRSGKIQICGIHVDNIKNVYALLPTLVILKPYDVAIYILFFVHSHLSKT
jgi:hypothetical protein